ncbi:MAG: hypothetical protein IPN94_17385 [Sphingobacteriales bacterium]|nr:hypothetical protein [Sphingobacteriales bacterium]
MHIQLAAASVGIVGVDEKMHMQPNLNKVRLVGVNKKKAHATKPQQGAS